MLNIIITYNPIHNSINDINNYIQHLNNINTNTQINIELIVISFNYDISNIKLTENSQESEKNNLIKTIVYNYKCEHIDSVYNEINTKCNYDLILYTDLTTFLMEPFLEYISLNKVNNNCFIRTNIIELEHIPNEFFEINSTNKNNIFTIISNSVKFICNENSKNPFTQEEYINEFNKNNNIINIPNDNIIKYNLHYLNHSDNFLLTTKKIVSEIGFNINNTNPNYTIQYLILNLIHHNKNMLKLPIILSAYKPINNNIIPLLDIHIEFNVSNEYNKTINYKIYDITNNTEKTYIRNHIKQLNAVHSNDLTNINKLLVEENTLLKKKINTYETQITHYETNIKHYDTKLNEIDNIKKILHQKNIDLETQYETLLLDSQKYKQCYLNKLSIINSNINELIIKEKNDLFQ